MKNKNVKETFIKNFKGEKIIQIECIFFKENMYRRENGNNIKRQQVQNCLS